MVGEWTNPVRHIKTLYIYNVKIRLSRKTWGKEFHKRCLYTIFSPQTFTMADANVYDGGCKRLRERMQTFAVKRGNALRERLQCTASEMGKTGTEIASPILDKRKGK